tara:strand:- start:5319 stop:6620 length:1302 start_codon:yes stop_codon:yes gene_type:complete
MRDLIHNVVVGLAVSFVALSLGAAFGILSGRGAFAGMLSAGVIAVVTSLLGGTRVQCSGPTAPMSVVAAVVISVAYDQLASQLPSISPEHFINTVFILSGVLLIIMALLRLGRFITIVPNVVISGFMNGIALLIWIAQIKKLSGWGETEPLEGSVVINVLLVISTLIFLFTYPVLFRKIPFVPPGTLIVIVVLSYLSYILDLPVGMVSLSGDFGGFLSLPDLVKSQWPSQWSIGLVLLALPYAFQLSLLCYLDTLLTSLVIDRMTGEKTAQNKEIAAQGIANGTVALMGGIPGAQATIRSVLVVKEGGSQRIVGFFIGFFVLVEMAVFQDLISFIPHAVFAGILIKAGYDVCDITTVFVYARRVVSPLRQKTKSMYVSHIEIALVGGTTLVTVLVDLNAAVAIFTVTFYVINKVLRPQDPVLDLAYLDESPPK